MLSRESISVYDSSMKAKFPQIDGFGAIAVADQHFEQGLLYALYSLRESNDHLPAGTGVCVIDLNLLCKDNLIVNHVAQLDSNQTGANPVLNVDEHKVIALPNALEQCFYTLPSSLKTNMRNFVDMEIKSRYLIWRQKNQIFYAVDVENMLSLWSMISGKLLYHR